MSLHRWLLSLSAAAFVALPVLADEPAAKVAPAKEAPAKVERPRVEVVFCVDTTGSMAGLINAAKQKIWSISNQIAAGKPTPTLKVGLVAFRDRGDQYVTKVFDLSDDLDAVYTNLMAFKAGGGGDTPESVNQGLNESVTKMKWSDDKKTLKIIFLVGDAPPHMDYANDVKYPDTCQIAAKQGIIINTIQCGNSAETRKYWQEICRLAEGSYVQIDQQGGQVAHIATPFDAELAKINGELNATVLVFGKRAEQDAVREGAKAATAPLPAGVAADRAAYNATINGGGTSYDLLRNVQTGKVKLEDLKKDELPPELQKMTLAEQKEHLKQLETRRNGLVERAKELNTKRNEFTAKKQAETERDRPRDGFDGQVLRILRRQATRSNIEYAVPEAKKD
jgi:Mg-chelatase subunit ChlD